MESHGKSSSKFIHQMLERRKKKTTNNVIDSDTTIIITCGGHQPEADETIDTSRSTKECNIPCVNDNNDKISKSKM